ncbi:spindle pole component BBP1 [Striga asiatica]|uniref:Spindle pole component BBP1 n=1 Tax=Striga asiatica TaxID=4170 RepID=A0A5A7PUG3_STRAF|nr:spindle pole component BBP1 [Striga asiatica]
MGLPHEGQVRLYPCRKLVFFNRQSSSGFVGGREGRFSHCRRTGLNKPRSSRARNCWTIVGARKPSRPDRNRGRKLPETWPRRTLVPSLAVVAGLWRSGLLRTGRTGGLLLEIADGRLSLVMTKDGPPLLVRCHGELPVKAATGGLRGSKDSPAACYRREFPEEITGSRLDVGG